jgi:hypothetical protein
VFDMTLASSYNGSFITGNGGTTASAELALAAQIAAGKAYLNIHSQSFTGGEIRASGRRRSVENTSWGRSAACTARPTSKPDEALPFAGRLVPLGRRVARRQARRWFAT